MIGMFFAAYSALHKIDDDRCLAACAHAEGEAASAPNVTAARRPGASRGNFPALMAASNSAASCQVVKVRPCWIAWLSRHWTRKWHLCSPVTAGARTRIVTDMSASTLASPEQVQRKQRPVCARQHRRGKMRMTRHMMPP